MGISKYLVDTAKQKQTPYHITRKLGEFQREMEAIRKSVRAFDSQRGCCRKMILGSRRRSTAGKHKSNLKDILEGVVVGCPQVHILENRPSNSTKGFDEKTRVEVEICFTITGKLNTILCRLVVQ